MGVAGAKEERGSVAGGLFSGFGPEEFTGTTHAPATPAGEQELVDMRGRRADPTTPSAGFVPPPQATSQAPWSNATAMTVSMTSMNSAIGLRPEAITMSSPGFATHLVRRAWTASGLKPHAPRPDIDAGGRTLVANSGLRAGRLQGGALRRG